MVWGCEKVGVKKGVWGGVRFTEQKKNFGKEKKGEKGEDFAFVKLGLLPC